MMHKSIPPVVLLFFCCVIIRSYGMPSDCGKGSFREGSECQLCPPGTYQNATDATSCQPCPRGHYFPYRGGQSLIVCRPCPENTFLNKMGAISKKGVQTMSKGHQLPRGLTRVPVLPKRQDCLSLPPGYQIYRLLRRQYHSKVGSV